MRTDQRGRSGRQPVEPAKNCTQHTPEPRAYERGVDLRDMYSLLMEVRSRPTDWRYCHVRDLAFTLFTVDCHSDPAKHVRVRRATE